MEDVLEVYARPPDPLCPVICMDEGSKELYGEVCPPLPPHAAQGEQESSAPCVRADYEYVRNGVVNIFMACEPLSGKVWPRVSAQRTRCEWAQFIKYIVDEVFGEKPKVVLVLDNLNTHSLGSLYEAFVPEEARRLADKLELHYTPVHGSWLNVAEIELRLLARQCLTPLRRIPDRETLEREIAAWQKRHNERTQRIDWQFTTADARTRLKRLYPRQQA